MAEILSVATKLPPHTVGPAETKAEIDRRFPPAAAARYARMVDATGIRRRHTVLPVAELVQLAGIEQRNERYVTHALAIGEEVARAALRDAALDAGDLRTLISVSCTGYMMPSLDAHLIGRLGIPPSARRIPITELGCSAGVAAIGLTEALLRSPTAGHGLVVSLELSSLSGQAERPTVVDMLANLLFGDAAAATVITSGSTGRGPEILAATSCLWPDSLDQLGVRLTDSGFRAFLSPELPREIRVRLQPLLQEFLAGHGLRPADVAFWAVHPGGPKILEAVAASLELSDHALAPSWHVLETCGNLSSASTFFILQRMREVAPPAPGSVGLMLAFGPGVTCEIVLLRAGGWLTRPS